MRDEDVHARQYYGEVGAHQTSMQPLWPLPCCQEHAASSFVLFSAVLFAASQWECNFGQISSTVAPSRLRELHEMVCRSVSQGCVTYVFRASL